MAVAMANTVTGILRSVNISVEAPEASAAAVFVDAFHVHVTLAGPCAGADDF